MRILGLDHGTKRIGVAVSDETKTIAQPLEYIPAEPFADFLARLKPFVEKLPAGPRFALEMRNKAWLGAALFDLLRKHNVALALIDHPWMPRPREWFAKGDAITADFTYIRWLGDRKAIEEMTKTWDTTIVDRARDLQEWVEACRNFMKRKIRVFAFANNHYAGHAPATLRLFAEMMEK